MNPETLDPILVEAGDLIRQKREELNLTQFELAELAGIGEKTVSRLELGKNMKLMTFFTLAEALGVTPNDISPSRFVKRDEYVKFDQLKEKFTLLNDKQKNMVCSMMNSIIDNVMKYS